MKDDKAIVVEKLNKTFKLPNEKRDSIKSLFINMFNKKRTYETQQVLKDISFEVKKGEFFGIVGRNGSGKSTLLKILGEIYQPDSGGLQIDGTLTPFIELGIGFNPELTGRENIYLNGAILGLTHKEIDKKYDEIVEFAELKRFMDQKLKNYSSGMQVRLAFSIAIQAHNDILLIDEVLAVGDSNFQKKCFNTFKEIKKSGKTVVFVTHDMGAVQDFCDRAMLINDGEILKIGSSGDVSRAYNELNISAIEFKEQQLNNKRSGQEKTRPIEIINVYTKLENKKKRLFRPKEAINITVEYLANEEIENPIMGITVKDLTGKPIIVINTKAKKINTGRTDKGKIYIAEFIIDNLLSDATYSISPAVASQDAKVFYDWLEDACEFDVAGWDYPAALLQPDYKIKVQEKTK